MEHSNVLEGETFKPEKPELKPPPLKKTELKRVLRTSREGRLTTIALFGMFFLCYRSFLGHGCDGGKRLGGFPGAQKRLRFLTHLKCLFCDCEFRNGKKDDTTWHVYVCWVVIFCSFGWNLYERYPQIIPNNLGVDGRWRHLLQVTYPRHPYLVRFKATFPTSIPWPLCPVQGDRWADMCV